MQECSGEDTGAKETIHATQDLFKDDEIEAVFRIDTESAFKSINREVMLHNISIMCPIISTFFSNRYCVLARLFVIGNKEIISREGMTQGDPTAMGDYALGVTLLLHFLQKSIMVNEQISKELAFADDFTVT